MEQIVGVIVGTNTQSDHELKLLRKILSQNHTVLVQSAHQIDQALQAIDPRVNSLGYAYLLSVKAATGGAERTSFLSQAKRLLDGSPNQIRIVPNQFVEIFRAFTKSYLRQQQAIRCIRPLQRAIRLLQESTEHLTPLHCLLLQVSLISRCYYVGAELLANPITEIRPLETGLSVTDFLLYCYYGGMVFIGLKRFSDAMRLLQLAITAPALALSAIIIEAYKKFILVALIADGKVPPLPKYTSGVVNRGVKFIIPPAYHEFVIAYGTHSIDDLHTIATKYAEVFQSDRNFGLVLQCIKSLHFRNIQRNTQVYLTLSLTDIKESGKLESEKEAEAAIVHMIETGSLTATISQDQNTVSFETDHEQYNTPEMAARLDQHIRTAIALDTKVKQLDETIITSPEYLQHTLARDPDFRGVGFSDFDEMQGEGLGVFDRISMMR